MYTVQPEFCENSQKLHHCDDYKIMRCTVFTFVFLLILLSIGCKSNEHNGAILLNDSTSIDKAIELVKSNPSDSNFVFLYLKLQKYCKEQTDTSTTNKGITYIWEAGSATNNHYIANLGYRAKCFQQLLVGNTINARFWAYKTLSTSMLDPRIDKLDAYHLVGLSYYMNPRMVDSTLKYWQLGFSKAIECNDDYRIYFFANNLGAFFYELDMMELSRKFFIKALNQAKISNTVSPTLINNIVNSLISSGNLNKAHEFLEEYKEILNVTPSNYENQSIFLNKIYINQYFRNFGNAAKLFSDLDSFELNEYHRTTYASLSIQQYNFTKEYKFLNKDVVDFTENADLSILKHITKEKLDLNDTRLRFFLVSLEKQVEKMLANADTSNRIKDKNLIPAIALLIQKYKDSKPFLATKYRYYLSEHTDIENSELDEFKFYINEINSIDELFQQILIKNNQIKLSEKNRIISLITTFSLIIILVFAYFYYKGKLNMKNEKERIYMLEKEMLLKEKITTDRFLKYSQNLLEFNKKIKQEFDRMVISGENRDIIQKLRTELLGFVTIDLDQNPKLADEKITTILGTDSQEVELEGLNHTEKRVYALLSDGFKPQEISKMLGITPQYIYNLKVKFKKIGLRV